MAKKKKKKKKQAKKKKRETKKKEQQLEARLNKPKILMVIWYLRSLKTGPRKLI